jgi:phosphoribosylamine--glycine ligase/phosphoribosylformylglycinamidine cyclo-ligase
MLFTGIMLTPQGPKVLEYNVRFGDPETQSLMALLSDDTDLAELMLACIERRLDCVKFEMKKQAAVTVVLAAKGYPGSYPKGDVITFDALPESESRPSFCRVWHEKLTRFLPADVWIFHAGTKANPSGQILTNGGRVLAVTAVAPTLKEAQALAYKGVDCVHFEGKTFRRDIAYK